MVKPAPFHAGDLVFAKVRFFISKKEENKIICHIYGTKNGWSCNMSWIDLLID